MEVLHSRIDVFQYIVIWIQYSLWTCSETMMAEHDHNEGFASVAWDRETDGGPFGSSALAAGADGHLNDGVASTSHQAGTSGSGSSSNAGRLASTGRRTSSTGPAARQQQDTDGRYYIKAGVRDPLKMHENTKDAYVSYCIKGEVCHAQDALLRSRCLRLMRVVCFAAHIADQSAAVREEQLRMQKTLSRLCVPARPSHEGFSGLRSPSLTRQASLRCEMDGWSLAV